MVCERPVGGNEALLPVLSVSAMIGAFAYFGAPYLAGRGLASTVACLSGGVSMILVNYLADKIQMPKLKEWALGIAMLCGMCMAMLFV